MKSTGTASFVYIKNPDVKYDPCWKITLTMTDEEAAKIKATGVKVSRNDDGAFEHCFKRNVTRKKTGGKNVPPRCVDINGKPFTEIIGNGSTVNVQWAPFTWEFKGKKGLSADFVAVQVVTHIPYVSTRVEEDEFSYEDGDSDNIDTPPVSGTDDIPF